MTAAGDGELGAVVAAVRRSDDPVSRFVTCWVWLRANMALCENELAVAGLSHASVPSLDPARAGLVPNDLLDRIVQVMGWTRFLDDQLGGIAELDFLLDAPRTSVDGGRWKVLRAPFAPMVTNLRRTSSHTYGGDIRTYAHLHICVAHDVRVSNRLVSTPAARLLDESKAIGRLRVEPLDTTLDVRETRVVYDAGSPNDDPDVNDADLLELTGTTYQIAVADPEECRRKLEAAIRRARADRVDVLLLPELSLPPDVIGSVRRSIPGPFPTLVVAGLCHHRRGAGIVNMAVIVDFAGEVVHEHQKITRANDEHGWEAHETASDVPLAPTPWGLVVTPICKDLFAPPAAQLVDESGGTLVLAPSLSPTTDDHQLAAGRLRQRGLAATMVCNRWGIWGQPMHPAAGASFAVVPGARPELNTSAWGAPLEITWRGGTLSYHSDVSPPEVVGDNQS